MNTPGTRVRTLWNSRNIWMRREVSLSAGDLQDIQAWLHHDEDAEIYFNGVLALKMTGWTTSYDMFELPPAARAALKPGKNLIAVHCRQNDGGQYVDLGFASVKVQ